MGILQDEVGLRLPGSCPATCTDMNAASPKAVDTVYSIARQMVNAISRLFISEPAAFGLASEDIAAG